MNDWLTFVLASLAVYRAARMITEEDGPAFVFKRIRARFSNDKRSLDVGLRCFYCVSFWAALPVVVLLCVVGDWSVWLWPVWWFGLSGASTIAHRYWNAKA
jgi:hypothetical protein